MKSSTAAIGWEEELAEQIAADEGCDVAFLAQVMEREIDGREVVMAKVHCRDGRTFDAERRDLYEPFTFRRCEGEERAC